MPRDLRAFRTRTCYLRDPEFPELAIEHQGVRNDLWTSDKKHELRMWACFRRGEQALCWESSALNRSTKA